MKKVMRLTWERLRQTLEYNPDTGKFIRLSAYSSNHIGKIAGCFAKPNGYWSIGIDNVVHQGHRLAWFYMMEVWPASEIDHINGVKYDNRWCNLREATPSQNKANRRSPNETDCSLKVLRGVYKRKNRYEAAIKVRGKTKSLGMYKTPEEAHKVFCEAVKARHGEFARYE